MSPCYLVEGYWTMCVFLSYVCQPKCYLTKRRGTSKEQKKFVVKKRSSLLHKYNADNCKTAFSLGHRKKIKSIDLSLKQFCILLKG